MQRITIEGDEVTNSVTVRNNGPEHLEVTVCDSGRGEEYKMLLCVNWSVTLRYARMKFPPEVTKN